MYLLATRLQLGSTDGIPRDLQRAVSLYEDAVCDGKHVGSIRALASCYGMVSSIEENMKKALQLFEMTAKEEDTTSYISLGVALFQEGEGVNREFSTAEIFEEVIDKDHNIGIVQLSASLVEEGAESLARNINRAVELHRQALLEENSVNSMKSLVRPFTTSSDVKQNPGELLRLHSRLEDLGESC